MASLPPSAGLGVGIKFCKFEKTSVMSLAEKKVELFQIVVEADEEMTGKLIAFAKQLRGDKSKFSKEELDKFHATRQKYLSAHNETISLEDAHQYIRSLKR
jgi:hypothetical protein